MRRVLTRNLIKFLTVGLALLVTLAVSTTPTRRVKAGDPLSDLKKFRADCTLIQPITGPSTGTCKGDHIGTATIVVVLATNGGFLFTNGASGQACGFVGSTETITTKEGSTLTLKNTGTLCFGAGVAIFNGGYRITGGTGKFAGATGAGGMTSASADTAPPFDILTHFDGNILGAHEE